MSEMRTTPEPETLPEQVAAALAEYARWGTGCDTRRPREIREFVSRQNEAGEWVEMTAHRNSDEAEGARHVQAMRAALSASVNSLMLSALKAMDEALTRDWGDPEGDDAQDSLDRDMLNAWQDIRSAIRSAITTADAR